MIKKTFLALLFGISAISFAANDSAASVEKSELANRLESLQQSTKKLQESVTAKKVSDMKFKVQLVMLTSDLKRATASFNYAKSLKFIQIALHKEASEHRTLADFLPASLTSNLSPDRKKTVTEAVESYFSGKRDAEKNTKKQELYKVNELTDDSLVVKGVKVAQELLNNGNLEDALFLCKLVADHYVTRANASEHEAKTTTQKDLNTLILD